MRVFPEPVRKMHASKPMRLRHEMWHFVRAVWHNPGFPEEGRQILRDLKWDLPNGRAPFSADGKLLFDNYAGEDFLFMHRQMIAMTDKALNAQGEAPIDRWRTIPELGDRDFPVPPVWNYGDPSQTSEENEATTQFLKRIKSDEYFERTMRVREAFLTEPSNLRRLSLGALGNLAEMTIHNMMHMRWSSYPSGYRPNIDLENPTGGDARWDDLSYDYLGDTYSSHVNPHFWYLHGWIDSLIDTWGTVNQVGEINWTGTWVGGPDLVASATATAMTLSVPVLAMAEDVKVTAIRRLAVIAKELPFATTLLGISRQQES